jgi:hypothetical protein
MIDPRTWFDKIFPSFMTGWKTYLALVLWLAWTMFIAPVVQLEAATDLVEFVLVAFGGASVASKLKRWEEAIKAS